MQRVLLTRQSEIKDAFRELRAAVTEAMPVPESPAAWVAEPQVADVPSHKQTQFERIQQLRAQGMALCAIAAQLGLSRNTVKKYARADCCPIPQSRRHFSKLEAYKPYLLTRWNAGCRNARHVWEELKDRGFRGGYSGVKDFFAALRRQHGITTRCRGGSSDRPPLPAVPRPPSLASLAYRITRVSEQRKAGDAEKLERLCDAHPDVNTIVRLAQQFAVMVRSRDPSQLGTGFHNALESGVAGLKGFAQSVWNDIEAVREGMRQVWSNGPRVTWAGSRP